MTPARDALLSATRPELLARLRAGHPIDPAAIEGFGYRGISLGSPRWLERLSWKTFQKTFYRDPRTGVLRGWNVRVEQRGVDAATVPRVKGGRPWTFGHYHVVGCEGRRVYPGCGRGLLIDYGLGDNPLLDPMRRVRDPLVALAEGSSDALLGWSWVDLGAALVPTVFYFLLEREGPIEHVP